MKGTPDVILPEMIVDVKSVWSPFTMPLFDDTPPVGYELQAQVYMHLTKRKHFELAYCLIDTPEHLIKREAYNWCNNNGVEYSEEVFEHFKNKMTYSDVPDKLRIKTYHIEYNPATIERIQERVTLCREYLKELI